MNAVLVSVDYTDLLSLTLPYNRTHFDRVVVVTDLNGSKEVYDICKRHEAQVYATNTFYNGGAKFNKWAALEEALTECDLRKEWLTIMDADVLWPQSLEVRDEPERLILDMPHDQLCLIPGNLCTPLRHMMTNLGALQHAWGTEPRTILPPESEWSKYPIHRNTGEWAGYSQIFHCSDPVLGKAPWHQTNWTHAGGADSFFQAKWSPTNKMRPPFNCLHLGEPGVNWFGRSSTRLDGSTHEDATSRREQCMSIWQRRRKLRYEGKDQFIEERL